MKIAVRVKVVEHLVHRIDEHDAGDLRRIQFVKDACERSAVRMPHKQVRRWNLLGLQNLVKLVRDREIGANRRSRIRLTHARAVVREHARKLRDLRQHRVPRLERVAEAGFEHDNGAAAASSRANAHMTVTDGDDLGCLRMRRCTDKRHEQRGHDSSHDHSHSIVDGGFDEMS